MHGGDWSALHNPNVTSEDVTALAEKRWKKRDWIYDPTPPGESRRPVVQLTNGVGEADDIAVATIVIYPEPSFASSVWARRDYTPRSP